MDISPHALIPLTGILILWLGVHAGVILSVCIIVGIDEWGSIYLELHHRFWTTMAIVTITQVVVWSLVLTFFKIEIAEWLLSA